MDTGNSMRLGINGLGRIGKLTLWHHVARKFFSELVVNIGREAGTSIDDIVHYIERDSTYGYLRHFLYGCKSENIISEVDEAEGRLIIDGVPVRFLRSARNPSDINWREHDVRLVVDTTGGFLDPTQAADHAAGALRGHIAGGAEKVVLSAPFKIKDKQAEMPTDAVTTVMGINEADYDPRRHVLVSNASCTTNCLAHMMKPLLDHFGYKKILSASMATIHAATSSQNVLDKLPGKGKTDLRKNRSVFNNIILTTTGAAKALGLVIPEMKKIGFIAESVRIPTTTGSLIILVVNLQEKNGQPVRRETINEIYRGTAADNANGYLIYTDQQNVSADIIGFPRAAAIIEGSETHTRTAEVAIDLEDVPGLNESIIASLPENVLKVPVTQAVIFGWYDNEMGSYVNMLGDNCISVAKSLLK